MALVNSAAIQKKKPLMLKDYLLDDLSSCSSSGFKSFPRRQCCTTTVRFLLELDIKSSSYRAPQLLPPLKPRSVHSYNNDVKNRNQSQQLRRSRSRAAASTTLSALQRASGAVIKAVKILSVKSSTSSSPSLQSRKGGLVVLLLPGSISRRLRRKSREVFTIQQQVENKDIGRGRSFRDFLKDDKLSDQTTTTTASSTTISTDNIKSNSWSESEFNSSKSSNENDAVAEGKMNLPEKEKVSGGVGVTHGDDAIQIQTTASCSPQNSNQVWLNKEEEKEQFSPVSVLDCPFEDEDNDITGSSPFRCRIARMEGTQHRLMQNIRRFEKLAQLEPLDLEKRIAISEEQDNNNAESKTEELLVKQLIIKTTSRTSPCDNMALRMKADKLVVDLFREGSGKNCVENVVMEEVVNAAEEWVNGESREMLTSWEVENGRQVYISDMDNKYCGKWMKLDEQEKEVGFEVEAEIWNSLFDEFLLDLIC